MFIKHFSQYERRVPHPFKPGFSTPERHLRPSGATHVARGDVTYEADENGWIDVPHEVGVELCRFRTNGSGFFEPHEAPADDPGPAAPKPLAKRGRR